jgi:hypothetical protein
LSIDSELKFRASADELQLLEKTRSLTVELDTPADRRDVARMLEEPEPVSDPVGEPTKASPASGARTLEGRGPPRVNKVHEWAAALAIMVLLSAIGVGFYLLFVRGVSL